MRIHRRDLESDGSGSMTLEASNEGDMWHIYHLLALHDELRATSLRKVAHESSSGSVSSSKVIVKVSLDIESIEFDQSTCQLRVKGKNKRESEFVKLGQYHTVEIEIARSFTLRKDHWDSVHLQRLDVACEPESTADMAAVVFHIGLAHICLISPHQTVLKHRIEMNVSKKRRIDAHDEAMRKFYLAIYESLRRNINLSKVKCVILASPAYYKDELYSFIFQEAQRRSQSDSRDFIEYRSKFLTAHSSSGYIHALNEALRDERVAARVADTKAMEEVHALEAFYQMLNHEEARAQYGAHHIFVANEEKAVDSLLISDELIRASVLKDRLKYVHLMEEVQENKGKVFIFSAAHPSGQALQQLSGVAAILRFPLAEELYDEKHITREEEDAQKDIRKKVLIEEKSKEKEKDKKETERAATDSTLSSSSSASSTSSSKAEKSEEKESKSSSAIPRSLGGSSKIVKLPISHWEDESDEEDYYYEVRQHAKRLNRQHSGDSHSGMRSSASTPDLHELQQHHQLQHQPNHQHPHYHYTLPYPHATHTKTDELQTDEKSSNARSDSVAAGSAPQAVEFDAAQPPPSSSSSSSSSSALLASPKSGAFVLKSTSTPTLPAPLSIASPAAATSANTPASALSLSTGKAKSAAAVSVSTAAQTQTHPVSASKAAPSGPTPAATPASSGKKGKKKRNKGGGGGAKTPQRSKYDDEYDDGYDDRYDEYDDYGY